MMYANPSSNASAPQRNGIRSMPAFASFHQPDQDTATHNAEIVFVLDARGTVQFCSAPASFARDGNELVDQPISEFLPGLPLRAKTPGYNIAFIRFTFNNDIWQRHPVKVADASMQAADVYFKPIPLGREHCLLGRIQLKAVPAATARSVQPLRTLIQAVRGRN